MWNEAVSIHNQSKLPMKRVASIFPANKRAFLYPFPFVFLIVIFIICLSFIVVIKIIVFIL